jgi:anthranilate synthase component 1
MEIIDALEPVRRGPYAGIVGYVDFNGNLDAAIAIRTMFAKGDTAWFQAGACAVGIGRELIPNNHVEAGDYAAVTLRVKEVCEWVKPARANRRK